MGLRPGYKQTDVGVLPEEWQATPLDQCVAAGAPICYGILMPGSHCNGGVPVVKVRDIVDGRIEESGLLLTRPSIDEAYRRSRLKAADVLVTIRGTTGRVADVPAQLSGANITQDTARVRVKNEISARFVYFALQAHVAQQQIALHTIGQAVKGINIRDVRGLVVALPDSIQEQRSIAAALSDVTALLDGLDRLIAKKRNLKRAAMQQLLTGQIRLPGFREEWRATRLGALGSIYGGLVGKTKSDFGVGRARYITFTSVMKSVVMDCALFEPVRVSATESQNLVLRGDLLLNGSSETPEEVALCALINQDVPNLYLNSFCFGFRLKDKAEADGLFLAYYIRSAEGRELMKSLAQGSTRYNLSKGALLDASMRLPKKDEQIAIAAALGDMDTEISALETRREKTSALKQAMMQELITGSIRLP